MKDVDIPPVAHEDGPARMRDCDDEESIEDEYGVNEELDVGKILRETEPVDIDLQTEGAI